jgi:DNA-binding GntR family transcriptional regulator
MRRDIPPRTLDDGHARETAASRAYQAIRELILRCGLAPGSAINERALMEEIGIGRTPVREALLRLSSEGLVIFAGQGIQVAPVTLENIRALYTARLHAERLAWQLWLKTAGPSQVSRLASRFDDAAMLAQRDDEEGLVELDFKFHSQIYEECGNEFLSGHLYNLTGLSFRLWYLANPHQREHHLQNAKSHAPIVEAVESRDAERLDREVTDHIRNAFNNVMDRMKGRDVALAAGLALKAPL